MRDVLAPPTRPAAFNLIKARVPLRMTSKFLKTPSSAAPSAWPSAIVRHAAPAAPAAPQFPQAMDGAQVMQTLLGMLQGQLQPSAPPPNDDINLRFFPPRGVVPAVVPQAPAGVPQVPAPALPLPADAAAPQDDADDTVRLIEDMAAGAAGRKLPRKRPAAAAHATPSPMKRPAAAVTPTKTKGKGNGAHKGKGTGKGNGKNKNNGNDKGTGNVKNKNNGKDKGKGKGTPKKKGQMVLGCSKCRRVPTGCSVCKNPAFGGVRGPR